MSINIAVFPASFKKSLVNNPCLSSLELQWSLSSGGETLLCPFPVLLGTQHCFGFVFSPSLHTALMFTQLLCTVSAVPAPHLVWSGERVGTEVLLAGFRSVCFFYL